MWFHTHAEAGWRLPAGCVAVWRGRGWELLGMAHHCSVHPRARGPSGHSEGPEGVNHGGLSPIPFPLPSTLTDTCNRITRSRRPTWNSVTWSFYVAMPPVRSKRDWAFDGVLDIDLKLTGHAWDPFPPVPSHPVSLTFYFLMICRSAWLAQQATHCLWDGSLRQFFIFKLSYRST